MINVLRNIGMVLVLQVLLCVSLPVLAKFNCKTEGVSSTSFNDCVYIDNVLFKGLRADVFGDNPIYKESTVDIDSKSHTKLTVEAVQQEGAIETAIITFVFYDIDVAELSAGDTLPVIFTNGGVVGKNEYVPGSVTVDISIKKYNNDSSIEELTDETYLPSFTNPREPKIIITDVVTVTPVLDPDSSTRHLDFSFDFGKLLLHRKAKFTGLNGYRIVPGKLQYPTIEITGTASLEVDL